MNARLWVFGLTLGLTLILRPLPADAKSPEALVAIITDRNTNPIVLRLNAELETFGFHSLIFATGFQRPSEPQILAMAQSIRGVAAISIFANEGVAEIWIIKPSGELVNHDQVVITRGEIDAIFALRVIEAMRARFLDLRPASAPAALENESASVAEHSPPAVITAEGERLPHFSCKIGGGVGWSPGGLSQAGMVRLSASIFPRHWMETALHLALPLSPAGGLDAEGVSFDAYLIQFALELRFVLRNIQATVQPFMGVGTQVSLILAPDDKAVGIVPYLALGLLIRLSERWSLFSDTQLGVSINNLAIKNSGAEVISWGRPTLGSVLGVGVAFF